MIITCNGGAKKHVLGEKLALQFEMKDLEKLK
jgi:hypothetical protein